MVIEEKSDGAGGQLNHSLYVSQHNGYRGGVISKVKVVEIYFNTK